MQPVRLSARLISGTRILSQPRTSKHTVCLYQTRRFTRPASSLERSAAPQKEPRDLASDDGPEQPTGWEDDIQNLMEKTYHQSTDDLAEPSNPLFQRTGPAYFVKLHTRSIGDDAPSAVSTSSWHPAFLRDCCTCPRCKDPSSTQKTFQTTDIPKNIKATSIETLTDGSVKITWENDIPGFGFDHASTFSPEFLYDHRNKLNRSRASFTPPSPRIWHKDRITKEFESVNYDEYMKDDEALHRALLFLNTHGLLLLKEVPESETAVEDIAGRIGTIRDTFYGRTWDVKSIPEAKNVAYTQQYLGLHMDLLYMTNPPGFQLLHCLKNTCEGGSSIFSDSFQAAAQLQPRDFDTLSSTNLLYQYKNAGEYYQHSHRVIEKGTQEIDTPIGPRQEVKMVNYSPPFQGNHLYGVHYQTEHFPQLLKSLGRFAKLVESPENLYEYKMEEGDCVIFNNRRVLHGRRAFDAQGGGQRWLKGTYVDTDVFMSRWRVLEERFPGNTQKVMNRVEGKKEKVQKPISYGSPFKKKKDMKVELEPKPEDKAEPRLEFR